MSTELGSLPRIKPQPAFSGILKEQETFTVPEDQGYNRQINSTLDLMLLQSGTDLTPSILMMLSILGALTLGGAAFVLREDLLLTALGMGAGAVAPIVVLSVLQSRRQGKIMQQMPAMVDELARAAKTGRSLEQCLDLVANDTPAPLGDELRLCTNKLALGVSLHDALADLPVRTGIVSMNVFVMALNVHQQTGGDLVTVMDRLSQTIRDRISFLGRLKAATAASRASALLMIGLPPAILTFFAIRDPGYFSELFQSTWGRNVTLMAIVLQIIGAAWVFRIMRSSQRT